MKSGEYLYLPHRRPQPASYRTSSSSTSSSTLWNVTRHNGHDRRRNCRRYPMRIGYHQIPLFVVVGTAFTSLISELRTAWYCELLVSPRNVIPSSYSTTVRAFTSPTPKHRRLLDLGGVVQTRPTVADMSRWSSNQSIYRYAAPFRPFNTRLLLRAISNINENNIEETWEQEIDDDDHDDTNTETGIDFDDDDDVEEALLSALENDNNESYDVDDDDDDDDDDVDDDIDTVVDQETENDTTAKGDPLVVEYKRWSVAVNKAIAALEKKQFSLEKEFVKAEQLESLQTRGQYLQSYRHMFTHQIQSVTVQDWDTGEDIVLTLDTNQYHSVGDEIDAIFTESKKLKRGKKVVATLLEQTAKAIDSMKGMKMDLENAVLQPTGATELSQEQQQQQQIDGSLLQFIQDRLVTSAPVTNFRAPSCRSENEDATSNNSNIGSRKKSNATSKPVLGTPSSNIRKVISPAGCTILVGRNRRGNEHLSLNLAQKQDIWMHARDLPGAHVLVVQRRGGCYATDECFQLAADLAAFYSDGRSERKVAVSAAEPKHIQKPRGAPLGAVKVREELRVYSGRPEAVPEEFKEARAISGLSNEYRIKDKSKLRKQNQQQVAEQKLVTKRKIKEKSDRQKKHEADKFY